MYRLVLPEGFLWHVFYSLANAICYCDLGQNTSAERKADWEEVVHMDIKPANVLITTPNKSVNRLYPCAKLNDFGKSTTSSIQTVY